MDVVVQVVNLIILPVGEYSFVGDEYSTNICQRTE